MGPREATADDQRNLQLVGWALPTRNSKQRDQDYQLLTLVFSPDTRPAMREQLDDCLEIAIAYTQRVSACLEHIENVTGAGGQVVHTVKCSAKMMIKLEADSLPSKAPYEISVDKLSSLTCRSG